MKEEGAQGIECMEGLTLFCLPVIEFLLRTLEVIVILIGATTVLAAVGIMGYGFAWVVKAIWARIKLQ